MWILFCIFGLLAVFEVNAEADEYAVRGTIESKTFFYDRNGNLVEPPDKEVLTSAIVDFKYHHKNKKWRLDITHPVKAFPGGVLRSIMPITDGGFISISSYPPRHGVPDNFGNAFVTVLTNKFFPAEEAYGAQAAWLIFNLQELIEETGATNGCPPFWKYDPSIHDLRVNSHMIIRTNAGFLFWNSGKYAFRDENQNVIFENGQPKMISFRPPFDNGFVEAEYHPDVVFLDKKRGISMSGLLIHWMPVLIDDSKPLRNLKLSEIRIKNHAVIAEPIPDSVFTPAWTNEIAVILDHRAKSEQDRPLTYITKSKEFNSSYAELSRQITKSKQMLANAAPIETSGSHGHIGTIIMIFFLVSTAGFVWLIKKSKT